MTKHVHAEMIKAKADNMDLVLFRKTPTNETWEVCRRDWMPTDLQDEYFLCLPQHKDACFHWLNGGEFECAFANGQSNFGALISSSTNWVLQSIWMNNEYELRIKPRKEKRWIGYCANTNQSIPHPKATKELAIEYAASHYSYAISDWQFIEIEVEI